MSNRFRFARLAAAALWAATLPGAARAADVFVTVSNQTDIFTPKVVYIQTGDRVIWRYAGGVDAHNVHADDNSYGNVLSSSAWTFMQTFVAPGTSRYYCDAHGGAGGQGMSGVVVVGSGRRAWTAKDLPYTLNAWDFSPRTSAAATGSGAVPFTRNGASAELIAGVRLPSGSELSGLELAGCDNDASSDITLNLLECLDPDGSCATLATVSTAGSPGCSFFSSALAEVNVDNLGHSYIAQVLLGSGSNLSLRSVRVFYRRTVSPPPAVASFADVPTTDSRFRFVEALSAAGITAGCGGGNYCPNQAVTRGQMAVFLSVALGLQWPN